MRGGTAIHVKYSEERLYAGKLIKSRLIGKRTAILLLLMKGVRWQSEILHVAFVASSMSEAHRFGKEEDDWCDNDLLFVGSQVVSCYTASQYYLKRLLTGFLVIIDHI